MRLPSIITVVLVAALGLAAQAVVAPEVASAQTMEETCTGDACISRVNADAKGILGGGILGAELLFMTNALLVNAGVRELDEWWAWILFPALGAAGGAVAGYFALEEPTQVDPTTGTVTRGFPEVAVVIFATSLALVVPTFVGVLSLTAYNPGADAQPGGPPEDSPEPAAEARRRVLAGGPGLLRVDRGALLLGVPMLGSLPRYTAEERQSLQLDQASDLHVPVVSATF